jgi:hypothetical protein
MEPDPIKENPKIKVIFKGFVITNIRDGAQSAMIGALEESVCHRPKVVIYKIRESDNAPVDVIAVSPTLPGDYSLHVVNPAIPNIRLYEHDNRPMDHLNEDNDPRDFRWFIDLDWLHGKRLTFNLNKLNPKFTLNNGLFHTSDRSDRDVKIRRPGEKPTRFGRYALEITGRIYLEQADSSAVLTLGTQELFRATAQDGLKYEVIFDCNCREEPDQGDFKLIYQAATNVDPCDQIDFEPVLLIDEDAKTSKQTRRRNPEVYCTGGNFGAH